jgi:endoribonuclease Dicer
MPRNPDAMTADSVFPGSAVSNQQNGSVLSDQVQPQDAFGSSPVQIDEPLESHGVSDQSIHSDEHLYSDDEDDDNTPNYKAPDGKAKRSARYEILSEWIRRHLVEIEQKAKTDSEKSPKEEILSIQQLLDNEKAGVVKDPREYQITLFEKAKKENCIAVLPTGSGKTLISVLLLRHTLDQEIQDRNDGKPGRFAFFLVNGTMLAFQQASVLSCNLDHKVLRVCGADGADNWSKKTWERHLKDTMVVVCTAAILVDCLGHGFLRLDQISILIFDEAHHAKANHPYAQLMREHYRKELDLSKRPQVFGMTASPVDAKVDLYRAALELEATLDARLITTPLSDQFQNKAEEKIVLYPQLQEPFETELYQQLKSKFSDLKALTSLFRTAKELTHSLGPWASDFFWSLALAEVQINKAKAKAEREYTDLSNALEKLNSNLALLQELSELISSFSFGSPTLGPQSNLSPKVTALHQVLEEHFDRPTSARCIVFIEQRWVARLLATIFKRKEFGGKELRVGLLIGAGTSNEGANASTYREQVLTLLSFHKGGLNCLFATSIAEEGIDIPDCNLVIRFDLYRTMIAYIQSKGRARHQNSKFMNMIEAGNLRHTETVRDARAQAIAMQNLCLNELRDRLLPSIDDDLDFENENLDVLVDKSSGAKVTFHSALAVINHFVAMLPEQGGVPNPQPQYIIIPRAGEFIGEVILPAHSPVDRCVGNPQRSKAGAKRAAAFELCRILHENQYLDTNFLPIYSRILPEMRNAQLALSSKKHNRYPMRLKPSLWTNINQDVLPTKLYLTTVDIKGQLDRPHQALGILSRPLLPEFPDFPLFMTKGEVPLVTTHTLADPLPVDEEFLDKLTHLFHVALLDIYNKEYEKNTAKMPYWIVPLLPPSEMSQDPFFRIDMETIGLVNSCDEFKWTPEMSNEFLSNKFIVDRFHGGLRYFSIAVDPDKKASDPVPEEAPPKKNAENILEYSISLFKQSALKVKGIWDLDQPVVEAMRMQFRRNLLARPKQSELKLDAKCWICPQPLSISTLPPRFVTMLLTFPAIIHRLEDYMIAQEACDVINLKVKPGLALEALTKDSDNSDEHKEDKINFRAGMGPNYERLEFLGDTFLKMATSISVYIINPNDDEFKSHVERMLMLCNANLLKRNRELKLYEYVRSEAFSRRTWYPPGITLLKGKGAGKVSDPPSHYLGDKSVADVCEALIGAAFDNYHNYNGTWRGVDWDAAVNTVTEVVSSANHQFRSWKAYADAYQLPEYQIARSTAVQLDLAKKVELEHSYHFNYPRLLASAFKHPSQPYSWDNLPSYQRLEFLGDSLFDVACVSWMYSKYTDKDPHWLTEHKTAMVSNRFLAALGVKLGFHKHMRSISSTLESQVREWVYEIERLEQESNGSPDYWTYSTHPPKCLGDIVESYIGAIFIDSNFNFAVVQDFFRQHVEHFFEDMSIYDRFAKDHPVTKMHETLSVNLSCQDYAIMSQKLPTGDPTLSKERYVAVIMIHDRVVAWKVGTGGRYAKLRVSKEVNSLLDGLSPMDYRAKFGCVCPLKDSESAEKEKLAVEEIGTNV